MAQSDSEGSADEPLQAGAGASGAAAAARRQLRPRSAQHRPLVDEHPELDALLGREEEGAEPSNQRQLDVPLRCAMVERDAPAASFAAATPADEVTATALAAAGLRRPLLIRAEAEGGAAAARSALGLRLPPAEHLTPAGLAEQLGAEHEVPTIDVPTQGSGPRVTLAQLADYLGQRQAAGQPQAAKRRRHQAQGALAGRLLNVVSLSLAGTALEASAQGLHSTCRLCMRQAPLACCWPCPSALRRPMSTTPGMPRPDQAWPPLHCPAGSHLPACGGGGVGAGGRGVAGRGC